MTAPQFAVGRTVGVVLVGAHPWANSAFDRLAPRPLLPIAHRPLVSYSLFWLSEGGVESVAVCANRETAVLESRLMQHVPAGMTISYHEDEMPRGAAGAVRDAVIATDARTAVVADGSSIPDVDLNDLLRKHRASGAALTVVVYAQTGKGGRADVEVPSGVYVCERDVLDLVPPSGFCDIKEHLIPRLYQRGKLVQAYRATKTTPRVLDSASYLAVNEWMIERLLKEGTPPEGYHRVDNALVHDHAVVASDALLVGPVLVGPGVRIQPGAVIVGPTSIGREALIGDHVLVSRSAIWRRCLLGEQAVIDRCILADAATVTAGQHAFRSVVATPRFRERAPVVSMRTRPAEFPGLESFRRVSRVLFGTAWSRYPAAQ